MFELSDPLGTNDPRGPGLRQGRFAVMENNCSTRVRENCIRFGAREQRRGRNRDQTSCNRPEKEQRKITGVSDAQENAVTTLKALKPQAVGNREN